MINKKRILVTGSMGQLGRDVTSELEFRNYIYVRGIDIDELDLTDEVKTKKFVMEYHPDVIIHNAAWTNVDKAEINKDIVYSINALAPKYLAEVAHELDAKMLYISTDYVFDGKGEEFFETNSPKNGLSVYGKTKSIGEDYVSSILKKYWIIRISWVFGAHGKNFIKTMIKLAQSGKKNIDVVADQIGSPTYTKDLANLIVDMIESDKYGFYHATNEGTCSWYELAKYVFAKCGYKDIIVNPITTEEYKKIVPNQAERPLNSRLSKRSLDNAGFNRLPDWRNAVDRYLSGLKELGEL